MAISKLRGTRNVLHNLNKVMRVTKNRAFGGLIDASVAIVSAAQDNVPVDWGNLRTSGYVAWRGGERFPESPDWRGPRAARLRSLHTSVIGNAKGFARSDEVVMGFSAFYAVIVHEDLEAHHDNGSAKFLSNAIKDHKKLVLEILRSKAKV